MSTAPTPARRSPQNIATAITDISERATLLVREEIELAKAEVTEKADEARQGRGGRRRRGRLLRLRRCCSC